MVDDNEGSKAESDVGGEVVEPDGQEEGAENQKVKQGNDCMGVHLTGEGEKVRGVAVAWWDKPTTQLETNGRDTVDLL